MIPSKQRFDLSPNDTNKLLTQEPLLIVRLSILKPGLPHYKTGKKETLSRSYLYLLHSTWARWWWYWLPQNGTPFFFHACSHLLHEDISKYSPIPQYGRDLLRSISMSPFHYLDFVFAQWIDQHFTSSYFSINMMSWECALDLTPYYSSRHTLYRLNSLMTNLRITPWITPWS
jgi:hypothetical protein